MQQPNWVEPGSQGPGPREEPALEVDRPAFTERVFQQRDNDDSGIVTPGAVQTRSESGSNGIQTPAVVKTRSGRVSKPVIGSRLYVD